MDIRTQILNFLNSLEDEHGHIPKFAHNLNAKADKVFYSGPLFDKNELAAAIESLVSGKWLSTGEKVAKFEREFSKLVGQKYSVMVNSGSSANLAMVGATKKIFAWDDGDEVIVSPVGFPTTVAPVAQHGLKPVFVDIEFDTLNFDLGLVEKAINNRTRAIFLSPVLGNPPNMDRLLDIQSKHKNLILLLDGCDSLGSKWRGEQLNHYASATTCSFYPAHHITTGEGGTVSSDNKEIVTTARSISWWGRDCYCIGSANLLPKGTCGCRFKQWLEGVDIPLDHKYIFTNMGYNLKPLDLQGAMGLEQLKKIDQVHSKRVKYKNQITKIFLDNINGIKGIYQFDEAEPSWFGTPFVCEQKGVKQKLVNHLEENGIQTRNYFAGNVLLHPGYKHLGDAKDYPLANRVLEEVFFVGCSPTYEESTIDYIESVVKKFNE